MLKQEFETRIGMEISAAEYEHIEACYMVCDLGKDDFCRYWAKANKSRIQQAKAEERERERAVLEKRLGIYG